MKKYPICKNKIDPSKENPNSKEALKNNPFFKESRECFINYDLFDAAISSHYGATICITTKEKSDLWKEEIKK